MCPAGDSGLVPQGPQGVTPGDLGAVADALGLDLTWFGQTAIDDTWSAIWFKHRSEFGVWGRTSREAAGTSELVKHQDAC